MLLLIALANVVWWFPGTTAPWTLVDQVWVVLRTMLVDQRAYPLFALLLGFGLTVLHRRATQRHLAAGLHADDARKFSTRALRRRGFWLMIFGAIHAVVFSGDILGAYGVAILLFASAVTAGSRRLFLWLGVVSATLSVGLLALSAAAVDTHGAAGPGSEGAVPLGIVSQMALSVAMWVVNIPATLLTSLVVAMLCWGAVIGQGTLLEQPARHRRTLRGYVVFGAIGVALGFPYGMMVAGLWTVSTQTAAWWFILQVISGGMVALGWCGVIGLVVARQEQREPSRWTQAVEHLGRMSLSGYLAQTVGFVILAVVLGWWWPHESLGAVVSGIIAVALWCATVMVARAVANTSWDRPAERALRRMLA